MRSPVGLVNAAAAIVAVVLALYAASYGARPARFAAAPVETASVAVVVLPDGRRGLHDATGQFVELRRYRRILAASTIADRLLHELAEPDRIVGVTAFGRELSPWAYQQADKPALAGADDLEAVLALQPDLVVLNSFGQVAKVTRLRERGIAVFDLGEMRGAAMLVASIHVVAHLVGLPERGVRLATAWQRRFAAVAAGLGDRPRRRAMYVGTYGGKLFGGTRGSSYGDILSAAGLVDVAARAHDGWPEYTAEELLRFDPDLVVTKPGMGAELCRVAGLDRLRVCRAGASGFIEIEAGILDDPGLSMLDAAEEIHAAAYPRAP